MARGNGVYDDEKQASNDDLHDITGIPKGQSSDDDAFEQIKAGYGDTASHPLGRHEGGRRSVSESDARAAKNERASQRRSGQQGSESSGGATGGVAGGAASLADKEKAAGQAGEAKLGDKTLSPDQAKQLEEGIGLYNPDGQKAQKGLTLFEKHRKGIIGGGIGGGIAMVIISIVFFLFPSFRIPSAMSLISNIVGEAGEEIVENRAQRMIIGYLINKAGGNTDNYVIQGGLLDTLWSTFRTARLEDKIKQQTGIEIERVGDDGRIRLVHDGRPMGEVNCRGVGAKRCYDTIIELSYKDALTAEDMRKIVRLTVPAWRFHKASKFAKYMRIKYNLRYGAPDRDKAKTDAQNLETLRTGQVDVVLDNSLAKVDIALDCTLADERCNEFNENNEPIDTTKPAEGGHDASKNQVSDDITEAGQQGKEQVVKNGGSFVEAMTERLLEKLVGKGTAKVATKAIPVVGWIDLAAVINHMTITAATNQIAARIPSILAAAAMGAMYAQWQGYGDEIKAGRMDILFVAALTTQMNGTGDSTAPDSCAYKFAEHTEMTACKPVDPRINNNLNSPRDELMSDVMGVKRWVDPLEWWYYTLGFLFRLLDDFVGWVISPLTDFLIDRFSSLMETIFGPDWQKILMSSIIELMFKMFGLAVDPLATGAQLISQLYAGADDAYNAYCRTNLGCRAMSQMSDKGFFCVPVDAFKTNNASCGTVTSSLDDRMDMAALSPGDRLFSLDEPYSLVNQLARDLPNQGGLSGFITGTFSQIPAMPGKLLSVFSANTYAATSYTPEQKAAVAGVRQYGATPQDLDQDVAQQVRDQAAPACPANDPENSFNLCQADKETAGSLLCVYADCVEFQSGGLDRPGENQGVLANLEQLWSGGVTAATGRFR